MKKVWYLTGASQGLGLTLVKKLLAAGFRVAATSRNAQALKNAVGVLDKDLFLALAVDLNNPDSIEESVRQTVRVFGGIDVLVNNAGYGMTSVLEDMSSSDLAGIMGINVLAVMNVTKSILPLMRMQRSGYIFNISSVAGFVGAPGWAIYSATKAAVTAFSEVLALDVQEFGIKVTVVEPSGFRTGFLTAESLAYKEPAIEGYEAVRQTQARYLAANGKQPGDPDKAAEILIALSETEKPPVHLYLGRDAYSRVAAKLSDMTNELEQWKETSISADFKD